MSDWARYQVNASSVAVASGIDEFTGWFDHYSRKYLGTVPGIDGGVAMMLGGGSSREDDFDTGQDGGGCDYYGYVGGGGRLSHLSMIMLLEYEPEFGPEDVPSTQLEALPNELMKLDLASVQDYLQRCAACSMRFEDRCGGFAAMRERSKLRMYDLMNAVEENALKTEAWTVRSQKMADVQSMSINMENNDHEHDNMMMASVLKSVPEIFFSPYFDLTDPLCFESLLVMSDAEVTQIREKEAELHALADRKVWEAERVAALDAQNAFVASRGLSWNEGGARDVHLSSNGIAPAYSAGALAPTEISSTHRTCRDDGNVITLCKPETLTSYLDAVELVLLDQVRSKSKRFFRETNRFSQLQQQVTSSVDEVRQLCNELQSIRDRCVSNVEVIPVMDDSRSDLLSISAVLEAVDDVSKSKSTIASLMGAGDHSGAVEKIRLARSLLADDSQQRTCRISLCNLKALSRVGEQLNKYEQLVIQTIKSKLVDTFLSWGNVDACDIDFGATPRISLTSDERMNIRSVVHSLHACGHLSSAGAVYQKKLCDLVSVTVKTIVMECVSDAVKNSNAKSDSDGAGSSSNGPLAKGIMAGVSCMSMDQFFDCINMLFEQVLVLLWGTFNVNKFCIDEGFRLDDHDQHVPQQNDPSATAVALGAAADLAEKSVSELLRLRREAHSLVSFDGMRQLWDMSLNFTHRLEKFSGRKAYGLRSTLLAQAKSFVERKHEANMSALVAALDSERWVQCNVRLSIPITNIFSYHANLQHVQLSCVTYLCQVSAERQSALTRLCSGRAAFSSKKLNTESTSNIGPSPGSVREKITDAEVEGVRYKVVWSCLLLLEMVMDDVACAAHFQLLATNIVKKVTELLRLFNTRSTHLVLCAGAIHSAARLKSINAKHLAIVTQCIALVLAVLSHIRAALMAQLPPKQHALLFELDKIKSDYHEHCEKILNKLVSIICGIVEHSLAPRIANTDFDNLALLSSGYDPKGPIECCPFFDNIVTNTKKMHQVLILMLPTELLQDVFSRIFAYLDHKVPSLFKAAETSGNLFSMPSTDGGKLQMINEAEYMAKTLNELLGVEPWNFTITKVLEQELDISRPSHLPLIIQDTSCIKTSKSPEVHNLIGNKEEKLIENNC